jgi:hypothetical protein
VGSPKTTGFGDRRWLARFRGTLRGGPPVLHCPPFALQYLSKRSIGRSVCKRRDSSCRGGVPALAGSPPLSTLRPPRRVVKGRGRRREAEPTAARRYTSVVLTTVFERSPAFSTRWRGDQGINAIGTESSVSLKLRCSRRIRRKQRPGWFRLPRRLQGSSSGPSCWRAVDKGLRRHDRGAHFFLRFAELSRVAGPGIEPGTP